MIEKLRKAVGDVVYARHGKGVHSAQTVFLITQAISRELSTEYGAGDEDGAYLWCPDENSVYGKGSRYDAERVIRDVKFLYDEDCFLVERLVSKGEQAGGGEA